jgi:hypothetical protein
MPSQIIRRPVMSVLVLIGSNTGDAPNHLVVCLANARLFGVKRTSASRRSREVSPRLHQPGSVMIEHLYRDDL